MGEGGAPDDWEIDCSDDEKYNPSSSDKSLWEPDPKDIKELFEKLSKGEPLTLEWKCLHGRRSPTPERTEEDMDMASQKDEEPKEEEKPAPKEFSFDEFGDPEPSTPITLRTPGSSKTPKSTKRVATLDKIMDDMRRHRKLNEEGDKGSKAASGSKTTKAASPGSAPHTPKGPGSKAGSLSPASTPHLPNKGNMSPKKLS